ncbi:hypothetical protein [Hymenobacter lucidus]|uniref:XRE family transcriptional regulator n=1 Tax=Hymenobacter lucidus TaxID=2880930 RepID=A0ABS8AXH8_9BACT|nr:hypothetical protein [Hymenobacter lucidus]MCB2410483.1 hypothetical protein [Hymenobacter lucidus]
MADSGTVGQRFAQLIAHLGISKNAFASSLDKTATVIQHLVDERNKPGFDLLCKVFEIYPNVSKDWLLQGTGPMLADGIATAPAPAAAPRPASLKAETQRAVAAMAVPTSEAPAPVQEVVPQSESSIAPVAQIAAAEPQVIVSPVVADAVPNPLPISLPEQPPVTAAVASPVAPAVAPDTSWQTALYTQQMAHQLAMAELRNQHLLDQQRMMQQMMDLMKQQMFK